MDVPMALNRTVLFEMQRINCIEHKSCRMGKEYYRN